MRLTGKIMRLVNTTVVITLFISTLNVSNMNTASSFSETQVPKLSRGNETSQSIFEEDEFILGLVDVPSFEQNSDLVLGLNVDRYLHVRNFVGKIFL